MNLDKKIERYLNDGYDKVKNNILYKNETEILNDIKNISKEFGLDWELVEDLYLCEMETIELNEAGVLGNFFGIVIFSPMLWAAWRALGGLFSKAKRRCGTFTISQKRDLCLWNVKTNIAEKKIKLIEKAAEECSKKDPDKADECKEKAENAIEKLKEKMEKYKEKAEDLKQSRDLVST